MITTEKCLIIDIDGTLCPIKNNEELYEELEPYSNMLEKIREYRKNGFYIILQTSRNMRTYDGNLGLINANTAKFTTAWLDKHKVPYDEIYFAKPWPGRGGFYVDDKSIRPNEFLDLTYDQIQELLSDV